MQKTKHRQLTVYGPDPLEKGEDGHFRYTMADIFPRWQAMIVGQGLHVTLADRKSTRLNSSHRL